MDTLLKKFIEGLAFGSGFAIAFMALWLAASLFVLPVRLGPGHSEVHHADREMDQRDHHPPAFDNSPNRNVPFYELSIEKQIAEASVIVLGKYEPSPDGRMKAVVQEILKIEPNTVFYYEEGDEYPAASYYSDDETDRGEGIVIFFTGSPAMMQMSTSFSHGRVRGLGDIPLELFREKCADDNT